MAKKARNKKKSKSKSIKTKKATKTKSNFVTMMVGGNQTGKTTKEIEIAKKWVSDNPKGHIIAYDPQGKIKEALGNRCITILPKQTSPLQLLKKLSKFLFIIDDTLLFASGNQQGRMNVAQLLEMLSTRRIKEFDFIFSVHNPSLLNKIRSIVPFVRDYYIFPTHPYPYNDDYKFIMGYSLVSEAVAHMNLYHKIWGKAYPSYNYIHVSLYGYKMTASKGIDKEKFEIVAELIKTRKRLVEDAKKLEERDNEVTVKKQTEEEVKNESHNADAEDMADFLIEALDVATKTNASREILSRLKKVWARHLSSLNGGQRTSFLNSVFMTTVTMAIAQSKKQTASDESEKEIKSHSDKRKSRK